MAFTDLGGKLAGFSLEDINRVQNTPASSNDTITAVKTIQNNIYETDSGLMDGQSPSSTMSNWYKALPYGFKFSGRDGTSLTFFLPISPNNITIVTHFATNVITTLYGTVEEHSEQRYFDIIIDGNTGMAPQNVDITTVNNANAARLRKPGRKSFTPVETIPSGLLGGFFSKTIGVVNQALNKAADVIAPQKNSTGVNVTQTGYMAFHNLYKFLLYYKKDTTGELSVKPRSNHPLTFFNYKDNNQYYCSVQRFVMKRSVDNPLIYNYTIQLRAYKIAPLAQGDAGSSLNDRKDQLGLNGVKSSSVFSEIKKISNGAKSVFGAGAGGLNIFGS